MMLGKERETHAVPALAGHILIPLEPLRDLGFSASEDEAHCPSGVALTWTRAIRELWRCGRGLEDGWSQGD